MFKYWRIGVKNNSIKKSNIIGALTSDNIKSILGDSNDIIVKNIYTRNKHININVIGIDGLVDSDAIDEYVLKPLTVGRPFIEVKSEKEAYDIVKDGFLYHLSQEDANTLADAIKKILEGNTVIVFNNIKKAIVFDAKNIPQRSVEAPENENVLKGAKDAFVENIRTNTALVRKKIKSTVLRFERYTIGDETNTPVEIVYLDNIADKDVLSKLREKISKLKILSLLFSDNFENNIKDNKYSIFPQIHYTERVDKFCANITDGKIGILIDGLPIGYIVPGLFAMFLQAPEDYAENYVTASFLRCLRYLCVTLSLILPAFYVAITTFHHEMIPTNLLISIVKSKEGVPFSSFFEILGLLIAFELLLEASLRLPKTIGSTISIIGGLIVGEAAVNAKFISPAVVVIIAITGIAGFVIPNRSLSNATRICRLILVFVARVSGLFGISFGLLILLAYLCKLESFGVPYFAPYVGSEGKGVIHDSMLRLPKDV